MALLDKKQTDIITKVVVQIEIQSLQLDELVTEKHRARPKIDEAYEKLQEASDILADLINPAK